MSNVLRVCHPFDLDSFLEYKRGKFTGSLSPYFVDLMLSITRWSNITLQVESLNGKLQKETDESNGPYSGCIDLLRTNQSDVMLNPISYPLSAMNLSQDLMGAETAISIISVYFPRDRNSIEAAQILNSFDTLSLLVWTLCFTTMIVSICLLLTRETVVSSLVNTRRAYIQANHRRKVIFYDVATHMTRYGQLTESTGVLRKIIFLVLSLFSFLVIFFMCSFIKTELVVIPPPETLRTYQQLLDHDCGIVFNPGTMIHPLFQSAPKGSLKKRLWDSSISRYTEDVVLFNHDGHTDNLAYLRSIFMLAIGSKVSQLITTDWAPIFMRFYCDAALNEDKKTFFAQQVGLSGSDKFFLPLASRDDDSGIQQKAIVTNRLISPPLSRFIITARKTLEAGLVNKLMDLIEHSNIGFMTGPTMSKGNATFGNMEQCMASSLFVPDAHFERVTLNNVLNCRLYVIYLVSIQLSVLLIERIISKFHARPRFRRRDLWL